MGEKRSECVIEELQLMTQLGREPAKVEIVQQTTQINMQNCEEADLVPHQSINNPSSTPVSIHNVTGLAQRTRIVDIMIDAVGHLS